uniref:Uncharacterized protein n=1 Tax=Anguilla anguilla TaxID=7936 RepID=A0A0E9WLB8_ANGAN
MNKRSVNEVNSESKPRLFSSDTVPEAVKTFGQNLFIAV